MSHVYISHAFSGVEASRRAALAYVHRAAREGHTPHASWIALCEPTEGVERVTSAQGLAVDLETITGLDYASNAEHIDGERFRNSELWMCGETVSAGMRLEASWAFLLGLEIRRFIMQDGRPLEAPVAAAWSVSDDVHRLEVIRDAARSPFGSRPWYEEIARAWYAREGTVLA